MTQRDSRSGQHGQHGQQPSAGTTDSYETLASAPEITLATLSSTERQWRRGRVGPHFRLSINAALLRHSQPGEVAKASMNWQRIAISGFFANPEQLLSNVGGGE